MFARTSPFSGERTTDLPDYDTGLNYRGSSVGGSSVGGSSVGGSSVGGSSVGGSSVGGSSIFGSELAETHNEATFRFFKFLTSKSFFCGTPPLPWLRHCQFWHSFTPIIILLYCNISFTSYLK